MEKKETLNPYEEVILAEMIRRAKGEDGDMPDDNLAKGLESKDKDIHKCFAYITAQARKQAKGNCAMVKDDIVYGWAHHYYIESNETIDAETKPKVTATAKVNKPAPKVETKTETKTEPKKKATYNDNPLLKAVSKKGKKKADTKPSAGEKVKKVRKNGNVYTITEFMLF